MLHSALSQLSGNFLGDFLVSQWVFLQAWCKEPRANAFTCKPPAVPGVDPEGGPIVVMHHGKGEGAGGVQKLLPYGTICYCIAYTIAMLVCLNVHICLVQLPSHFLMQLYLNYTQKHVVTY